MNKTELIAEVAKKCGMSKKDAEKAVTTTFDTIADALSQGDKVQLVGFGGFETKKREARMGRNPKTKEAIEIPATTIPVFKAGKALKDIYALKGKMWDKCYNGHHDFRPLGAPLADDVMPNLIDLCDQLVSGNYEAKTVPGMFPNMPERTVVTKGTVMVTFKEGGIHEPKK